MPLDNNEAHRLIAAAHDRARELGIRVTVAVVDEGGHLQALSRMDGAPPLSSQIAESKAVGAAVFHRDGAAIASVYQERPGFYEAVNRLVRLPLVPGPGSVLLRKGDAVLGAVGVSGGRPEQDLDCAQAGVRAL